MRTRGLRSWWPRRRKELVERIGLPEARITLAQCVCYLALAPKSNASYTAIEEALEDVREGRTVQVPKHIKDGNVRKASRHLKARRRGGGRKGRFVQLHARARHPIQAAREDGGAGLSGRGEELLPADGVRGGEAAEGEVGGGEAAERGWRAKMTSRFSQLSLRDKSELPPDSGALTRCA